MDLVPLVVVGLAAGSDNLAAAVFLAAAGPRARTWQIVWLFGSFEFAVPLIGFASAVQAVRLLGEHPAWVGPAALGLLAMWSLLSALRPGHTVWAEQAIASWAGLVVLATTLSLDNLLVGFAFGLRGTHPAAVASAIGISSALATWLGLKLGRRGSWRRRRETKVVAGALLGGLSIAMLLGWV